MIVKVSTWCCPRSSKGFTTSVKKPFFYELNLHKSGRMELKETDDVNDLEIEEAERIDVFNFNYTHNTDDNYSGVGNATYKGKNYPVILIDTV